MKRIYFFNDWYAQLPWYIKTLVILPVPVLYYFQLQFDGKSLIDIIVQVTSILFILLFYALIIFQARCKNAFIYESRASFGIRLNGNRVNMQSKHVSQISLDQNHVLQIRRLNRVDTFNLAPYREKDRKKMMKLLKECTSGHVVIENKPSQVN